MLNRSGERRLAMVKMETSWVAILVLALALVVPAAAQPPAPHGGAQPGQHEGAAPAPGTARPGGPGMMGGHRGMAQGGMVEGMCPMMGMMGGQMDGRTMQMRGEMMKAMGDIMIKYGKMMETQP